MTIYQIKIDGINDAQFACDLSRASGEIQVRRDDGDEWRSTPYQVGHGNHDADEIAILLVGWGISEGDEPIDDDAVVTAE